MLGWHAEDGHYRRNADSFEGAEAWLKESPFYANDLYERVEVAEFMSEVGYVE